MTKFVQIAIYIGLSISLSSCLSADILEVTASKRTVLVYIAGDNDLRHFATDDIEEMKKGMNSFDESLNNLLVYVDTGSAPELFRLSKDREGNAVKELIRSYPEQNSVDVEVMKTVFEDAFNSYQAESYGLLLWSHAEGWLDAKSMLRFFGQDGNNFMNISELKEVLRAAPHFDYIYFEACFMSGIEVVYELRDFADYFIGSPTETPGPGAPYDLILPALFASPNAAVRISDIYFADYKSKYNGGIGLENHNWTAGAAISVVKSAALEGLAAATRRLLPLYVPTGDIPTENIMSYDTRIAKSYHHDMNSLMLSLTHGNDDYLQWKSYFDQAVVSWHTTEQNYSVFAGMFSMTGSSGLSIYIPRSSQPSLLTFYKTFEWYQNGGWAF